jgi:hypothetical protein
MLRAWNLIALTVLFGTLASTANAQPQLPASPAKPGPPHRPDGTVVARVNVNVETEVDVSDGSAVESDSEEEDSDGEKGREKESDIGALLEAVLKQAGPGSVIADININVETSIKVRMSAHKPGAPKPPAVKAPATEKEAAKPVEKSEKPAVEAPRKKRRKKRGEAKPATSVTPESETPQSRIALNRLKIGDTLELGVTGELSSEQRANQIAQRINVGKNQTLLGMAFVGMMLPEEAESLKVVQKAISSVQANATGNELSVSVAIPKETPGAVKTLVEAALERK